MTHFQNIVGLVHSANIERKADNLARRIIKLGEEFGETSEAYLNVSSASNGKNLTWDDVREELADCLIVALDVALTPVTGIDVDALMAEVDTATDIDDSFEITLLSYMGAIGRLANAHEANEFLAYRDSLIVLVEIGYRAALFALPDQTEVSASSRAENLTAEIERKLAKWARNRDTGQVATDAE